MTDNDPSDSWWSKRFENQSADETISRFEHRPRPIEKQYFPDRDELVAALSQRLNSNAIASGQATRILKSIVSTCFVHARSAYSDPQSFLAECYRREGPTMPAEIFPRLLTGPAGSGKTTLINRLQFVLPSASTIPIADGHPIFPLVSHWRLSVRNLRTITEMLKHLIVAAGGKPSGKSVGALVRQCRRLAYKAGVCLLVVDELQFLTKTAAANAKIVGALFDLADIGIPIVYGANYSLAHRLKARPQEDRQRLLSKPYLLLPDPPESDDWTAMVKSIVNIAPDLLAIDAMTDSSALHSWTAGTKRLLCSLVLSAVSQCSRASPVVGIDEIRLAYESADFSCNREDVEELNLQFATGKKPRKDLHCPFDIPASQHAALKAAADATNMERMTHDMLVNTMTPGQQDLYRELQVAAAGTAETNVVAIGSRSTPTLGDFERGAEILRDIEKC